MAKAMIVNRRGPPCVRCHHRCVVLRHKQITPKMLRQPYYYSQWYRCVNPRCKTTLIMPDECKVFPDSPPEPKPISTEKARWVRLEQRRREERAVGNMQSVERPPWEE